MKKFQTGFTLAEVLITLGIIGVIAAIMLPSTMSNHTYKTLGVKLGKFASQLENSTRPFVIQNDSFDSTDNYALVNTYLEESFLIKNEADIKEQEVDVNGEKQKQKLLINLSGKVPTRGSSATGFTESGKFSSNQQGVLDLKDGTSMVVYPLKDYTEQDEINPYKVGEVVFGVTFSPNVKGLPNTAQQTYDFVVTSLGYVYPNEVNDKCSAFIYKKGFDTNAATFKTGMACALSTAK